MCPPTKSENDRKVIFVSHTDSPDIYSTFKKKRPYNKKKEYAWAVDTYKINVSHLL